MKSCSKSYKYNQKIGSKSYNYIQWKVAQNLTTIISEAQNSTIIIRKVGQNPMTKINQKSGSQSYK